VGHNIPIVIGEGSPYARGYHLGSSERVRVRHAVHAYMVMFRAAGLRQAAVYDQAERFLPVIDAYAPHLVEEMRGIAEGTGHDLRAIVALNCRTELLYAVGKAIECTSLGVTPPASADGHVRLAQNWDWHPSMTGALVLWVIRRADGPDLLTLTEAGMVGKIGANARGLAMVVNLLTSDADHPGPALPMHVILRKVLEDAGSVSSATAMIAAAARCSSCNHMLADCDGNLADVEATPQGIVELRSDRGVLTHTNHCLDPDLAARDSYARDKPDTLARGARAEALAGRASLDEAAMRAILADHSTAPKGICRHPQPDLPFAEQAATIASLIFDLTAGTLALADGEPCETPYRRLRLSDYLRLD
jgi:isopenicillin-N N-acyltransferase-like protein